MYIGPSTVTLKPTPDALKKSYPAANWIKKPTEVVLLKQAVIGSVDVYDVKVGENYDTCYGFNIQ